MYSKIIHAIQIVRYLRYKTGKFNQEYWKRSLQAMANAMMKDNEILKNISKSNKDKDTYDAIKNAMKNRIVKKQMTKIEAKY